MQRLSKALQRQRLDVVLQIRRRLIRIGLNEGAQLTRCHGQRTTAVVGITQAHADFAPQAVGHLVEGAGVAQFKNQAQLQVVLQVAADTRQLVLHRYPQALQQWPRADARALQNPRRANRARAQDDFAACAKGVIRALPAGLHLRGAVVLQQHFIDLHAGQHGQVGTLEHGADKRFGGIPAHTGALVHLKVSTALIVAAIEVIDAGDAVLRSRVAEGIQNRPGITLLLNPPLALGTVQRGVPGIVFFTAFEQRQYVLPGPALIAHGCPAVVITGLTTHVDHAVDRRAAAQHLTARVTQAAALQAGLGFGFEAPVSARVTNAIKVTHRDMDPRVVVLPTRFEQQHVVLGIGRQPIRQHRPRRPGAHHNVVVDLIG